MLPGFILCGLLAAGLDSAADAVTLRDGQVARGQVVEPAPRGKVILLVRRAWAGEHLPGWLDRWEKAEAAWAPRARRERLRRLELWRQERRAGPAAGRAEPIGEWLDREIARFDAPEAKPSVLMAVQLGQGDVKAIDRRDEDDRRRLRQGWRAGIADVEEMDPEALAEALRGRGFAVGDVDPAPVEDLLPIQPETEERWRIRRAATEVRHEPGLRFIQHLGLVLPERPAGAADPATALAAVGNVLGGTDADPLPGRLREVALRGRVGAVVTRLDLAADLSAVTVTATLWVRTGRDRWVPAGSREAVVRPDEVAAGAGAALAADPQVQGVFRLVESLGFGTIPDDLRRRSLNLGAATQTALGRARSAFDAELDRLALPVGEAPAGEP